MGAPDDVITRWRLIDEIEQAPPGALVLLVAAAGYGKSTLLQQWRDRTPRAAAVVVARPEDDAGSLVLAIARVLVRTVPEAADLLARAERAEVDWTCDLLPPLLALASERAIALAIDDAHVLTSPSSRELLAEMGRAWPRPSVLILSGRERPPVPLVRADLTSPVVVIGERDLDFDFDELEAVASTGRSRAGSAELMELTGGWPAGVRLAAMVRDEDFGGSAMTVERYLANLVLSSFSAHELDYLGYLALLAPARAEAIDAVLRRDDTLSSLRSLRRRGLPMVEVPDDPSGVVVIHALLAQVLRARLERRHPQAVEELIDLGVETSVRTGDLSYGFALLDRHGRREQIRRFVYVSTFPLISQGRTRELQAWLDRFPPAQLESDPLLVFAHANVLRPRDEARVRTLFAPHAIDTDTVLPDGTSPALACRRMLTAFGLAPADPDDTGLLGGWRQTSGVTRAWDLYADDRLDLAEEVLLGLRDSAPKYPLTDAVGLAKLAILALETGRPELAQERAAAAEQIVTAGHMEETALGYIVDAVAIKLARRVGDLDLAEQRATDARRKIARVGDGTLLERATTLLEVANLYLDLGAAASSIRDLRDEAAAIVGRWPRAPRLDRQVAQVDERLDALGPSAAPLRRGAPTELLTTAELRVLRYLPSHLTLGRIAAELYVSHSTVKSQCQAIYRKLGVSTRADAVASAAAHGLLA
jgi:LuxR family maltose regulon positive regulatory protein